MWEQHVLTDSMGRKAILTIDNTAMTSKKRAGAPRGLTFETPGEALTLLEKKVLGR